VLESGCWQRIPNQAKQPVLGQIVDDTLGAEAGNARLKGMLEKQFACVQLKSSKTGGASQSGRFRFRRPRQERIGAGHEYVLRKKLSQGRHR